MGEDAAGELALFSSLFIPQKVTKTGKVFERRMRKVYWLPVRQYSLFYSSLPLRCGVHFLNFPLHGSENRCVEVDWNAYGYGNSDI